MLRLRWHNTSNIWVIPCSYEPQVAELETAHESMQQERDALQLTVHQMQAQLQEAQLADDVKQQVRIEYMMHYWLNNFKQMMDLEE